MRTLAIFLLLLTGGVASATDRPSDVPPPESMTDFSFRDREPYEQVRGPHAWFLRLRFGSQMNSVVFDDKQKEELRLKIRGGEWRSSETASGKNIYMENFKETGPKIYGRAGQDGFAAAVKKGTIRVINDPPEVLPATSRGKTAIYIAGAEWCPACKPMAWRMAELVSQGANGREFEVVYLNYGRQKQEIFEKAHMREFAAGGVRKDSDRALPVFAVRRDTALVPFPQAGSLLDRATQPRVSGSVAPAEVAPVQKSGT